VARSPADLAVSVGELSTEWPILRMLGAGLCLYYIIMMSWTVRTLGRVLVPGSRSTQTMLSLYLGRSLDPSPSILGYVGALARGSLGYSELAATCTVAAEDFTSRLAGVLSSQRVSGID
jgi:hypothetical protein